MTDIPFVEAAERIGYEGGRGATAQVASALQAIERPEELVDTLWSIRTAVLACGARLPESFGHSPAARAKGHHLLALLAVRSGAMSQAIAHFEEGRALAGTLEDSRVLAELELDFCSWVRPEAQAGLADEFAKLLARWTDQVSSADDLWRGRLALARGRLAFFRGQLDDARALLREAELEFANAGFLHGRGRARLLLAAVLEQFEGDVAGLLESAHDDALAGGDRHLAFLTGLSWSSCIMGHDVRAAAATLERLLEHPPVRSVAANVHVLAGQVHTALGNIERADLELARGLALIREHGLAPGQALLVLPLAPLLLHEQETSFRRALVETASAWLKVADQDGLPLIEASALVAAQALGVEPNPRDRAQRLVRLEQARLERDAAVLRAFGYEGQSAEDRRQDLAQAKATFARLGDQTALANVEILRAGIPGDLHERRTHALAARQGYLAIHDQRRVLLADVQLAMLALERRNSAAAREQLAALATRLETMRLTRELGELYFWLSASYSLFSQNRRKFMDKAANAWAAAGMDANAIRSRLAPLTPSKWQIIRTVAALLLFLLALWLAQNLGR